MNLNLVLNARLFLLHLRVEVGRNQCESASIISSKRKVRILFDWHNLIGNNLDSCSNVVLIYH